jgi:uncharacterized protein YqfB (UPF0267 family)
MKINLERKRITIDETVNATFDTFDRADVTMKALIDVYRKKVTEVIFDCLIAKGFDHTVSELPEVGSLIMETYKKPDGVFVIGFYWKRHRQDEEVFLCEIQNRKGREAFPVSFTYRLYNNKEGFVRL